MSSRDSSFERVGAVASVEAVSLYAFRFLVSRHRPDGVLREPTQIGLDVAVRQLAGLDRKAHVCKDLVLWPEPAGGYWDSPAQPPAAPLPSLNGRPVLRRSLPTKWLLKFSAESSAFVGFAVSIDPRGTATTMTASRVRNGVLTRDWLRLPEAPKRGLTSRCSGRTPSRLARRVG